MTALRFLLSHLGPFALGFWLLLLVGALDGAAGFSVPILLSEFTKQSAPRSNVVREIMPLLAVCLVSSLILQWCLRRWAEALQTWFGNDLRIRLFREVEALSLEVLSQHHSGYITSLINQVSGSVGSLTTTILWLIGHITVTLVLFFICTAHESVALAWANVSLLALFVGVSVILARRMVPLADRLNKTSALAAERFIDLLTNVSTVKKLGIASWGERLLRNEFALNNQAASSLQRFHANRWALLHSIFFATLLATIALILSRVASGATSPSILILFIAGFSTIRSHVERLSELIRSLLETNAYITRLTSITAQRPSVGTLTVTHMSKITLKDVSFSYRGSTQQISIPYLSLHAGERVLITGESGQGKSTLLSILAGQRITTIGQCLWNDSLYQHYNHSLQEACALASQEAELFNLSLRENLRMGRQDSDEELRALLSQLGLDDLLTSLPEGFDTKLGEKGLRLSVGQKQRINLARAILLKRPVLLLDEPTSNLDEYSERCVLRCLASIDAKTTIVIVSHQRAFRSFCSRWFEFEGGILSER